MTEYTIEAYETKDDFEVGEPCVDIWEVENEDKVIACMADHVPECEYGRVLVDDELHGEIHRVFHYARVKDNEKPKQLPSS